MKKIHNHILLVQKKRIKQIVAIVFISTILGLAYPVLAKEFSNPWAFVNGAIIGFLGGVAIAVHEDYDYYKKLRREHFLRRLLKSVLLYTIYFAVIIASIVGLTYGLVSGKGVIQCMTGPDFHDFIFHGDYYVILLYTLFFCGLVSFTLNMSRKIESSIMLNMISGKYRTPKEELRVFMSIDLNNSTEIAEELGEEEFFDFLNKFYFDLTPAIIATNGQIYRYVGDQVLISWPVGSNAQNSDCLRAYFIAKNELSKHTEEYYTRWGLIPSFKAAFHAGSVVSGEIGDIKSQFVFHGKAIHIVALIEKQCKSIGVPVLLSSAFTKLIDLPRFYRLKLCSSIRFDEQTDIIDLYTVERHLDFVCSQTTSLKRSHKKYFSAVHSLPGMVVICILFFEIC